MKAADVIAALRASYQPPEWATFTEVTDGTGAHASRRADMIAMNLYPSKGLEMRCIEVKVSRSDLAAELRDPEKAETFAQFCDGFWLATPKGLAGPDELPAPWGLIEVDGNSARVKRRAAPNPSPIPPSKMFMAGLLRAASKVSDTEIRARITAAEKAARLSAEEVAQGRVNRAEQQAREQVRRDRETLDALMEMLGVEVDWALRTPDFCAAVKLVQQSGVFGARNGLGAISSKIDHAISGLTAMRDTIQSGLNDVGPRVNPQQENSDG